MGALMTRLSRPALRPPKRLRGTTAVSLQFAWEELDELALCDNDRPLCSRDLPAEGAVYRLRFHVQDRSDDHIAWYVGETENLRRRMEQYRNPSKDRPNSTNHKIHDAIVSTKLLKGTVALDRVIEAHG